MMLNGKKKQILITILLTLLFSVYASSLSKRFRQEKQDSLTKAETYFEKGMFQDALDFYRKVVKKRPGDSKVLNRVGQCLQYLGYSEEALEYFKTMKLSAENNGNETELAVALNNLGEANINLGNYEDAIDFINEAITYNLKRTNREGLGINYNNLGKAYFGIGDYEKAIINYEKSLDFKRNLDDYLGIGITLSNEGLVYYKQDRLGEAEDFFNAALKAFEKAETIGYKSWVYNNLSMVFIASKEYEKALDNLSLAEDIDIEVANYDHLARVYINTALVFELQRRLDKSLEYINEAIRIKRELNKPYELYDRYLKKIEKLYKKQNN